MAYVFEQIVDERRMEFVEEDDEVEVAVDEKPVLVDEAYNLDNKTVDNDLVQNEIVVVAVEELILDLKVFRQYSKYKKVTLINIKEIKN